MREMYESVNIIFQILTNLTLHTNINNLNFKKKKFNFFFFFDFLYSQKYNKLNYNTKYNSMESLINHFKLYFQERITPKGVFIGFLTTVIITSYSEKWGDGRSESML